MELQETRDLVIFVKGLAALLEQVLGVVDVGLFKLLVGLLRLCVVLVVLVVDRLGFQLGLVVRVSLLTLLGFDELVIEVLEVLEEGDCQLLVVLALTLHVLEFVALDLEHFEVVVKRLQVLDGLVEVAEFIGADREQIQTFELFEVLQFGDAVLEKGEVLQLTQRLKAFDLGNQIEAQIQPGQVDK